MTGNTTIEMLPEALLDEAAYPHRCRSLTKIETHMSWVFLTGEHAYKVKKQVRFPFADFSTGELRRFFCFEELRLNRRFAPATYVAALPVVADRRNGLRIGRADEADQAVEWAVQMRQFDPTDQADHLLEADQLSTRELYNFGQMLARQHAEIPPYLDGYDPRAPMVINFESLAGTRSAEPYTTQLAVLREHLDTRLQAQGTALMARRKEGFVRECHGDLHLANLVRLQNGLCAFDCLEFDANLRNIDVMSDTGFLFMDFLVRGRSDLGYAFIDGYLNYSGDYEGTALLPLFTEYRAMVRTKVAALRLDQTPDDTATAAKLHQHIDWTTAYSQRSAGRLIVMHGVSGSGKSYWAGQLVSALGALRLRSDVLRKVSHGLSVTADGTAEVGESLYSSATSAEVYEHLARYAEKLLKAGETVIVDAACLQRTQRQVLYNAAVSAEAPYTLVSLTGPRAILAKRIAQRAIDGGDPSDADLNVLDRQLRNQQLPQPDEPVCALDTTTLTLEELLTRLL